MAVWLSNWRSVWASYRASQPLPPLRFRRGFILFHGPDDDPIDILHDVFASGSYRRLARHPNGVLIDVGANIGAVTMEFVSRCPDLVVHAYEPAPSTADRLRRNIHANHLGERVVIYAEAVGSITGQGRLWLGGPSVLASMYGEGMDRSQCRAVSVPMISLNDAVARVGGRVGLLKIDAEGAEADILEGASFATLKLVDRVILEYHDDLVEGARDRCATALAAAGFRTRAHPLQSQRGILLAW